MTKLPWNWKSRASITISKSNARDGNISIIMSFIKGLTPKGYAREIGLIEVSKSGFVLNSHVHPRMRNKGIGKFLYVTAMKLVGRLSTDLCCHSDSARLLWLSMINGNSFKLKRRGKCTRLTIKSSHHNLINESKHDALSSIKIVDER